MKKGKKNSLISIMTVFLVFVMFTSCEKSVKGTPKLVDLGADRCIPCQKMAPILEELKDEYAGVLDVEFIDVWKPENQQEAVKYGVEKIPTQIYFDHEGNELWRHVGFISKEDILKKWNELGYDLKPVSRNEENKSEMIIDESCEGCNPESTSECGSSGC